MDKRPFIDVLKDREEIKRIETDKNIRYKFHNILYYIKERYDLPIVNLAKVFGTTRQTIYNYFKINTDELPDRVKETIKSIYGVLEFEEVLEKELKVEKAYMYELPFLQELVEPEGLPPIPDEDMEVFEPYEHVLGHTELKPKRQYDFQRMWNHAVETKEESSHPQYRKRTEKLDSLFEQLKETHSEEYLAVLFKILAKRIETNDEDFILYLMDYTKKQ